MIAGIARNKERAEGMREAEGCARGLGDTHRESGSGVAVEQMAHGIGCCTSACDTEDISDIRRRFPITTYLRLRLRGLSVVMRACRMQLSEVRRINVPVLLTCDGANLHRIQGLRHGI